MKKISRRKFILTSAQSAAGLSIAAGCNSRSEGPDIRPPSSPTGLDGYVKFEQDGTKQAILSWNPHNLTDITGAPSETAIAGYNIFCEGIKLNTDVIQETGYIDEMGPDFTGLQEGQTYSYHITAVDVSNNESPASKSIRVRVLPPSKIYKVTNTAVSSNLSLAKDMIHAAVMALTQKSTVAEAYEALFPENKPDIATTVAIKVNCLAGRGLCTHPEVVEGIIDGLSQMLGGSFPLQNITVFDDRMESLMMNGGFTLKNNPDDYKVLSTYGETNKFGEVNWGDTSYTISGSTQRLSTIAETTDYIINVPVLKDHNQAGVTFALKNFYGIIDNPEDMHDKSGDPDKRWCDPFIPQVYKLVAEKVICIVGDAIFGVHNGGPSASSTFIPNTILVSTDPVAIDMHALKLINDERSKYTSLFEIATEPDSNYPNRVDARHIISASSDKYDLGTINREIIEVSL